MREKLIEARGTKSQLQVAGDIGISQQYLSKIESGERNPGFKLACAMSKYYQTSMEELFPDIFLQQKTPKSSKWKRNKEINIS